MHYGHEGRQGERLATCEEQIRGLTKDVLDLTDDQRKTRHALRNVEGALRLRDRIDAGRAERERRWFLVAGLILTATNILVTVIGR